jgi:hypothetical protein
MFDASRLLRIVPLLAAIMSLSGEAGAAEWLPRRDTRVISFSGYDWFVKDSAGVAVGPGPNLFAGENVRVENGRLHLRISRHGNRWTAAEVVTTTPLGYGTYTFHTGNDVADLDPNIVLGLFTWSDDPAFSHREIDIEVSRWGDPADRNAQCVVQPYSRPGSVARFELLAGLKHTAFSFFWLPETVICRITGVLDGPHGRPSNFRFEHRFTDGIPVPDGQHARINLWQLGGQPPARNQPQEIVVSSFTFAPASGAGVPDRQRLKQ